MIKCQKAKPNATAKGDDPLLCQNPIPLPLLKYLSSVVIAIVLLLQIIFVYFVVNRHVGKRQSFDTRSTEHQSRRENMKLKEARHGYPLEFVPHTCDYCGKEFPWVECNLIMIKSGVWRCVCPDC